MKHTLSGFLRFISNISIFLCAGCAPIWNVNQMNVSRDIDAINRKLTAQETQWLEGEFSRRLKNMPKKVAGWTLEQYSSDFIADASMERKDFLHGARFRFLYRNEKNQPVIFLQHINPVRLHFDEVGMGRYDFHRYHYPRHFLLQDAQTYLFFDDSSPSTLFTSSLSVEDKDAVRKQGLVTVLGYTGASWEHASEWNKSVGRDAHIFTLNFQPTRWRSAVYAELWVIEAPTVEDAKDIAFAYQNSQQKAP